MIPATRNAVTRNRRSSDSRDIPHTPANARKGRLIAAKNSALFQVLAVVCSMALHLDRATDVILISARVKRHCDSRSGERPGSQRHDSGDEYPRDEYRIDCALFP